MYFVELSIIICYMAKCRQSFIREYYGILQNNLFYVLRTYIFVFEIWYDSM